MCCCPAWRATSFGIVARDRLLVLPAAVVDSFSCCVLGISPGDPNVISVSDNSSPARELKKNTKFEFQTLGLKINLSFDFPPELDLCAPPPAGRPAWGWAPNRQSRPDPQGLPGLPHRSDRQGLPNRHRRTVLARWLQSSRFTTSRYWAQRVVSPLVGMVDQQSASPPSAIRSVQNPPIRTL